VLDIHVKVLRKGNKSMTYGIEISVDGRAVAEGRVTSVCCELRPGEEVRAIPIPSSIADRIEEAPEASGEC
jgi:acyl-CoA thioesterase FadM